MRLREPGQIAGVDEAGRGPLAGPVVAAAVVLGKAGPPKGLDDSKRLSPGARARIAAELVQTAEGWGIGVVSSQRIDATNIRLAALEAMRIAYLQLVEQGISPDIVIVDGRDAFECPPRTGKVEIRPLVGGDGLSANVAAASVLAKVWRDRLMLEYHFLWPEYGFDRHKGYPTRDHIAAIERYGPCPIHRLSFNRVRQFALWDRIT
ncbi:MAG: ribonuclease HII [Deltaproteobacteria bacterium]|nr:MAG: ribonuclease HII [Deltaproteobacteria bacterium]